MSYTIIIIIVITMALAPEELRPQKPQKTRNAKGPKP